MSQEVVLAEGSLVECASAWHTDDPAFAHSPVEYGLVLLL